MWRKLLPFFFFFSLTDGFVSNALFPLKMPLLFKDIFLVLLFVNFSLTENFRMVLKEMRWALGDGAFIFGALFMAWACLETFNPSSPGLLLGLLGLKTYFLYWVMMPICYAYIRDKEDVWRFLRLIAIFSIPINIFGMIQFYLGPDFLIGTFGLGFARAFSEAALEGYGQGAESFYRIIGTFASTGQYSNFLSFNTIFCLGLVYLAPNPKRRFIWVGVLVLNVFAMLAAGSRGAVLLTGAMAFGFIFFSKRLKSSLFVVAAIAIFFYFGLQFLGGGVQARFQTLQDFSMVQGRTVDVTGASLMKHLDRDPLGRGPGSASTAARHLDSGGRNPSWRLVENFPAKLQVELGFVGVVLFFIFLSLLVWKWTKTWLVGLDARSFSLGTLLTSFGVPYLILISLFGILDTPPGYIYIWVVAGMTAKLAALSHIERSTFESYEYT